MSDRTEDLLRYAREKVVPSHHEEEEPASPLSPFFENGS